MYEQALYAAVAIELRGATMRVLADEMSEPVTVDLSASDVTAVDVAEALMRVVPVKPSTLTLIGTCQSGMAGWDGVSLSDLTLALQGMEVTQVTEADALATVTNGHGPTTAFVVYAEGPERWYVPSEKGGLTTERAPSERHDMLRTTPTNQLLFAAQVCTSVRRLIRRHEEITHVVVWSSRGLPDTELDLWSLSLAMQTSQLQQVTLVSDPNAVLAAALKAAYDTREHAKQSPPEAQE